MAAVEINISANSDISVMLNGCNFVSEFKIYSQILKERAVGIHPDDHQLERNVLAILWTGFGKSVINHLIPKVSKTSAVNLIKFWVVFWNIPVTMFILVLLLPFRGVELVGVKPEKRRTFFVLFCAPFFMLRSN